MLIQALTFCFTLSSICRPTANSILSVQSSQAQINSPSDLHNGKSLSVPTSSLFGPPMPHARLSPIVFEIFSGKTEPKLVCLQIHDILGQSLTPSELFLFVQSELNIAITGAFGQC